MAFKEKGESPFSIIVEIFPTNSVHISKLPRLPYGQ